MAYVWVVCVCSAFGSINLGTFYPFGGGAHVAAHLWDRRLPSISLCIPARLMTLAVSASRGKAPNPPL